MKLKNLITAALCCGLVAGLPAATATLTADTAFAPDAGGTVTFTATITDYTTASALGWGVVLPTGWAYASTSSGPGVAPAVGSTGTVEWAYITVPTSPATFTFTATCPAGVTAPQMFTSTAYVQSSGTLTTLTPATLTVAPAAVPTVTTGGFSEIGRSTATVAGAASAANGASVTARGIVYSTSADPTLATGTTVASGSGTGDFSASLGGLAASTTYHVRAYATNAVGTNYGDDVNFTTTTALGAPTITSVTATGSSGTAEAGSTVSVYDSGILIGTTTANGSGTWSLSVTLADGPHSITATAADTAGNVSPATVGTVVTIDTIAPTAPTGLAASATSTSVITLTWTASTDTIGVSGYRIYRAGTAVGTSATTSYNDTGLTAGTSYSYTVTALDAAGHESAASTAASATTLFSGAQTLSVGSTSELLAALTTVAANPSATYTVTLSAGTYNLGTGLTLSGTGLTLQGSGTAILDGAGLASGALVTVTGDQIVIFNLAFQHAPADAIAIVSGADLGTVADCTFVGTGISGTSCPGWIVTGNAFSNLAGSAATARAALSFGSGATGLTITDNVIFDCDRGIALTSLADPTVRNNFIADRRTTGHPGAGITLSGVTGARVDNNTLYQAGSYANAIEYSGGTAIGAIRNNLANKPITAGDTATATLATNYTAALASWFRNPTAGDLHLAAAQTAVVNAGTTLSDLTVDIDGDPRPTGSAYDIGADEYQPDTVAPSVPTGLSASVLSANQIKLSWNASTDTASAGVTATGVSGYRIYRNGSAVGTSATTSYSDTGLTAATAYSYTVTAYDGSANESAASTAVSATTSASGGGSSGGGGGGGGVEWWLAGALALLALARGRCPRGTLR